MESVQKLIFWLGLDIVIAGGVHFRITAEYNLLDL